MKKIQPFKEYVLLERDADEEMVTSSGIILQQSDESKQYHGVYATVLEVGPDVKMVAVGDRVIVNKYDTLPIRVDLKTIELVKEELIYAKCE